MRFGVDLRAVGMRFPPDARYARMHGLGGPFISFCQEHSKKGEDMKHFLLLAAMVTCMRAAPATRPATTQAADSAISAIEDATARLDAARAAAIERLQGDNAYRDALARLAELDAAKRSESATAQTRLDVAKKWLVVRREIDGMEANALASDEAFLTAEADLREVVAADARRREAAAEIERERELLYRSRIAANPKVGAEGIPKYTFIIIQVVGDHDMIARYVDDVVWLKGWNTAGHVDGRRIQINAPVRVTGTTKYVGGLGTQQTVLVFEPHPLK